jgi:hypothetical protein
MRTVDTPLRAIIGHSAAYAGPSSITGPSTATPSQSRGTAAPAGAAAARQSNPASVRARSIGGPNTVRPASERIIHI